MSPEQLVGLVMLTSISIFALGFVVGYSANPDDSHD